MKLATVIFISLNLISSSAFSDTRKIVDIEFRKAGPEVSKYCLTDECCRGNCKGSGVNEGLILLEHTDASGVKRYYLRGQVHGNTHQHSRGSSIYGGEMTRQPPHTRGSNNTGPNSGYIDIGYLEVFFLLRLNKTDQGWVADYTEIYRDPSDLDKPLPERKRTAKVTRIPVYYPPMAPQRGADGILLEPKIMTTAENGPRIDLEKVFQLCKLDLDEAEETHDIPIAGEIPPALGLDAGQLEMLGCELRAFRPNANGVLEMTTAELRRDPPVLPQMQPLQLVFDVGQGVNLQLEGNLTAEQQAAAQQLADGLGRAMNQGCNHQ